MRRNLQEKLQNTKVIATLTRHTQVTSAVGHEKATTREALSHMFEASEILL
jgi:hypothetical protein